MKESIVNRFPKYFNNYEDRKIPHKMGPFDKEGVPMFKPTMFDRSAPICYHPTVVIQYGFARYNLWLESNDPSDFKEFKICANWLKDNVEKDDKGRFLCWSIPFGVRTPRIKPPWISCITQGQGLSLLLRLNKIEPNPELENVIHGITKSFLILYKDGGILSKMTNGRYFLQETGDICILNGCIAAIVGLLEYLEIFDNPAIKRIAEGNINYLEEEMEQFDMGWWSKYSTGLRFNIADKHYHKTHIDQLNYLGTILQNETFLQYAKKWERYWNKPANHRKLWWYRLFFLNLLRSLTILRLDIFKFKKNKDLIE